MLTARLLIVSLLAFLATPLLAQAPAENSSSTSNKQSTWQSNGVISPEQLRQFKLQPYSPEAAANITTNASANQDRPDWKPWLKDDRDHQRAKSVVKGDDYACLTLRTYRVVRDDPNSDATRPAAYTSCQPAARFQMKTTVMTVEEQNSH
jgi:hypothetical protein